MQENNNYKEPAFKKIALIIANEVIDLYHQFNIPTLSIQRFIEKLIDYNGKLRLIKLDKKEMRQVKIPKLK